MVYTYLYNEVLAAGKTTDPLFTSVTAANIVEGQLDEKRSIFRSIIMQSRR